MCFFDQTLFTCGYWKWGSMRQYCSKARYTGEGCGIKLIWVSQETHQKCRICYKIEAKKRRIRNLQNRVERWSLEAGRWKASMALAEDNIRFLNGQITQQEMLRRIRRNHLR
jgi:hypothetical protein